MVLDNILEGKYKNSIPYVSYSQNPDGYVMWLKEQERVTFLFKADCFEENEITNEVKGNLVWVHVIADFEQFEDVAANFYSDVQLARDLGVEL